MDNKCNHDYRGRRVLMVSSASCNRQLCYIYNIFYAFLRFVNDRILRFILWKTHISSVPPHFIKFKVIKEYKNKFNLDILVETGTYLGDTVDKAKSFFKEIHSIEVDSALFKKAQDKYAGLSHIHITKGDSAEVLLEVTGKLSKPALFWLDAHYSGGVTSGDAELSPIVKEVESILKNNSFEHVLLIDDAHLFNGKNGYPDTQFLEKLINQYRSNWSVYLEDNIIRVHSNKIVNA